MSHHRIVPPVLFSFAAARHDAAAVVCRDSSSSSSSSSSRRVFRPPSYCTAATTITPKTVHAPQHATSGLGASSQASAQRLVGCLVVVRLATAVGGRCAVAHIRAGAGAPVEG